MYLLGQDITAGFGYQKSVFKLSRSFAINSYSGPIVWPQHVLPSSFINHRFNSENVTWSHYSNSLILSIMRNRGRSMEQPKYWKIELIINAKIHIHSALLIDTMSAISFNNRKALPTGKLFNNITDFTISRSRFDNGNGSIQTFPSTFN